MEREKEDGGTCAVPSPTHSGTLLVREKSRCQRLLCSLFHSREIECGSGARGRIQSVIHIFRLFGSWLNRNLHCLMSGFFLGNENKFPT